MKKLVLSRVLSYVYPVLLGALLALDYALFIVPNNFAPSGVNGIAVMIQHALKKTEYVSYISLLINVPLCVFAYFKIDKTFAVNTLLFSLSYSLIFLLLTKVEAVNNFLQPFIYSSDGVDTIYPSLIAGLIMGFCIGFSVKNNSSTGGTDIIAKYVSKIKPNLNFFYVTFVMNALVALASYFVFYKEADGVRVYDYKPVCLCVIYAFVRVSPATGLFPVLNTPANSRSSPTNATNSNTKSLIRSNIPPPVCTAWVFISITTKKSLSAS